MSDLYNNLKSDKGEGKPLLDFLKSDEFPEGNLEAIFKDDDSLADILRVKNKNELMQMVTDLFALYERVVVGLCENQKVNYALEKKNNELLEYIKGRVDEIYNRSPAPQASIGPPPPLGLPPIPGPTPPPQNPADIKKSMMEELKNILIKQREKVGDS